LAASAHTFAARALGRIPYGGRLRIALPWPIASLDPAVLDDGFGALFASAVFEPLFGVDASGSPYPALADGLPVSMGTGCRLALRPGLKTAAGRELAGADVIATLARARLRGAAGLLGEIEAPQRDPKDPLAVVFPQSKSDRVVSALSSPLTALVPRNFSPLAPDGCGAFRVELAPGRAIFTRNPWAARGLSYLDAIEVSAKTDLAELLRGFEAGETDVGWFGSGLYRSVKDAVAFETPRYAFAVLIAGKAAGAFGAPGALQPLLDAIPAGRLAHLGLRGLPEGAGGAPSWGGPATTVVAPSGAPQLLAAAQAVAASLSTAGHLLRVVEKSAAEIAELRASRQFGLLVDCVRAPSASPRDVELALRTAANPDAVKHLPKTAPVPARLLGRQISLGIIGELCVWGARRAGFGGLESWQLGGVFASPTSDTNR
jgi:peptide/nickel transport system substrate-binding protein